MKHPRQQRFEAVIQGLTCVGHDHQIEKVYYESTGHSRLTPEITTLTIPHVLTNELDGEKIEITQIGWNDTTHSKTSRENGDPFLVYLKEYHGINSLEEMSDSESQRLQEEYRICTDLQYDESLDKYMDHEYEVSPFKEINGLKEIILEPGIRRIGPNAFSHLKSLETVKLPDTIKRISSRAFYETPNLQNVNLPSGITKIDDEAFSHSGIQHIVWPELGKIAPHTFESSDLTSIELPQGLKRLEAYCFQNCKLKSIVLPDSVTYIGKSAFENCDNLKDIRFSENLSQIDDRAFKGCTNLESVYLPDSVNRIGKECFANCSSLKIVRLPETLTHLGDNVFAGCTSLKEKGSNQYSD